MALIGIPETSVLNDLTPCNNPLDERISSTEAEANDLAFVFHSLEPDLKMALSESLLLLGSRAIRTIMFKCRAKNRTIFSWSSQSLWMRAKTNNIE
jgi:hypothetical protein